MKQAGFRQLEDHRRGGACHPGCYIDGQHRQVTAATVAPKNCPRAAAPDDQNTLRVDGDFGSFVHRRVSHCFLLTNFGLR